MCNYFALVIVALNIVSLSAQQHTVYTRLTPLLTGNIEVLPYFISGKDSSFDYNFWNDTLTLCDDVTSAFEWEHDIDSGNFKYLTSKNIWVQVYISRIQLLCSHNKIVFPSYLPITLFKSTRFDRELKAEGERVIGKVVLPDIQYDFSLTMIYNPFLDDPQTLGHFWNAVKKRFPELCKDRHLFPGKTRED